MSRSVRAWPVAAMVIVAASCGGDGGGGGNGATTGPGPTDGEGTSPSPTAGAGGCIVGGGGYLRMPLSGAHEEDVDWGDEVDCGGVGEMDGTGFTVTFTRDQGSLAVIIVVEDVEQGQPGSGAATVTIGGTELATVGGLFTTPNGGCTVEVTEQHEVGESGGVLTAVTGTGSCPEPARPPLGDPIDIGDFEFSGPVGWQA